MELELLERLSSVEADLILGCLPERIRAALVARANEIEYPIEAVIEMAIASFLDDESISFVDCNPNRGK